MNTGKSFEQQFADSINKYGYAHIRLVDAAKWLRGESSLFTPSNVCDSILFTPPFLNLLELKSSKQSSISFKRYVDGVSYPWETDARNYDIKPSQVKSLLKYNDFEFVNCGFILNFRERETKKVDYENEAFYVSLDALLEFAKDSKKGSINREEARECGFCIPNHIKKINYEYDIDSLAINLKSKVTYEQTKN